MKKLLAIFMAVSVLVTMNITVFAENGVVTETVPTYLSAVADPFVTVYTECSHEYYNPGNTIELTLSLRDISLGSGDGISAFAFVLSYDKDMVTPVVSASLDEDETAFDFTSLMSSNPLDSWEGVGKLDTEKGEYDLAFGAKGTTVNTMYIVAADDSVVVKIPFKVNSGAKADDIVFSFDHVEAYNSDSQIKCDIVLEDIRVAYALQPDETAALPENALPLDIAGYKHAANNVIYYAENDITVGEYIQSYITVDNGQDDMNYFAIIIVDESGRITYADTVIGRPVSDKSDVLIPAGSYLIGVNGNKTEDLAAFTELASVGNKAELFNVNVEATDTETAAELIGAGFVITEVPEEPDDSSSDDSSSDDTSSDDSSSEEENIGDVNEDGAIDQFDYILVKRYYFETIKFTDEEWVRANVNLDGEVNEFDYIILKRIYFETIDFEAFLAGLRIRT